MPKSESFNKWGPSLNWHVNYMQSSTFPTSKADVKRRAKCHHFSKNLKPPKSFRWKTSSANERLLSICVSNHLYYFEKLVTSFLRSEFVIFNRKKKVFDLISRISTRYVTLVTRFYYLKTSEIPSKWTNNQKIPTRNFILRKDFFQFFPVWRVIQNSVW